MKTIWTVIGVIVLIIILVAIYKTATNKKQITIPATNTTNSTASQKASTDMVTKETVVVQPVYVQTLDCGQAYQDNVIALFDTYRQKRVIYNNAINSNDPNVAQYHKDLNDAYNNYYNEAAKCNFFVA